MRFSEEYKSFKNKTDKKYATLLDRIVINEFEQSEKKNEVKKVDISVIDGVPGGESTKIYNITKIKQRDMIEVLLQHGLLYTVGDTVTFVLSMLLFISVLAKNTKIQLREREAKILYCIYTLGNNFSYDRIKNKYTELFNASLKDIELVRSVDFLEKLRVLKQLPNDEVELLEEITIKYE